MSSERGDGGPPLSAGMTSERRELIGARIGLALTSLLLALPSLLWFDGLPPLGNDASSHIVMMARIAEALQTGAGWWAPDFNLGFPIGLYYQPLPHFVGGLLTAASGGGTSAIVVYKFMSVLAVALYPWGVAYGARALGMRPAAAAAAGLVAPLVASTLDFGLTIRSSLILGLHTQAWAAVVLPVALGQMARALDGKRGASAWATVSWAVLYLCHFFYGVALLAIACLWIFARPRDLLLRFRRLVVVGSATLLSLLFWFLPLLTSIHSMGGWPFGRATRTDGYGFAGFLEPLLAGELLDGAEGLPALSLALVVGLVLCFVQTKNGDRVGAGVERRLAVAAIGMASMLAIAGFLHMGLDAPVPPAIYTIGLVFLGVALLFPLAWLPSTVPPRLLLLAFTISVLFSIGRAGLGSLADLFFFNRAVQMFRYLGLFHLTAIWIIGWGVGQVLKHARQRWWAAVAVTALLALALIHPVQQGVGQLLTGYRTMGDTGVDLEQYYALVDRIAETTEEMGAGRIFVHPRSGLHGHYHSGLLALWDGSDAGESYGVGLHDSLNFYFLEFFHPERERTSVLTSLYGFQYIAGDDETDFEAVGAEPIHATADYTYWRLDHRVPMCDPIDVSDRLTGYPRELRRAGREWLNGGGPRRKVHPLATIPPGIHTGDSTDAPVQVDERMTQPVPRGRVGHLLLDQREPDRLTCRVDMNRAGAVLFRMGYHPFWRAWVDGERVPLDMALPAFSAVAVEEGEHEVVIRYQQPNYVHPLMLLGILPTMLLWFFDRRS